MVFSSKPFFLFKLVKNHSSPTISSLTVVSVKHRNRIESKVLDRSQQKMVNFPAEVAPLRESL